MTLDKKDEGKNTTIKTVIKILQTYIYKIKHENVNVQTSSIKSYLSKNLKTKRKNKLLL